MSNAAKKLYALTKVIVIGKNGSKVAQVAVSVDGTWQKRGHTSKIGVVFVISIDTGEVLDFEIKSLFCHVCSKNKHLIQGSDAYKKWWKFHEPNCNINHKGSSDSMETEGAI